MKDQLWISNAMSHIYIIISSPIICFSIIAHTAFTDVSFVWPYIGQVSCPSSLITSGFTDHSSPNCRQKYRKSRLQYVYIIKFSHNKKNSLECTCYFGMLCTFFQQSDFTLSLKRTRGIFTGKCIHTKQQITIVESQTFSSFANVYKLAMLSCTYIKEYGWCDRLSMMQQNKEDICVWRSNYG